MPWNGNTPTSLEMTLVRGTHPWGITRHLHTNEPGVSEVLRTPKWDILHKLPWPLGAATFVWPCSTSRLLIITVRPRGRSLAHVHLTTNLIFSNRAGDDLWPHGDAVQRALANYVPFATHATAPIESAATIWATWSIDHHIGRILDDVRRLSGRARACVRPQIARRFHQTLRAMVDAAGTPSRRQALSDALDILSRSASFSLPVVNDVLRADRTGRAIRHWAQSHPFAFALATRDVQYDTDAPEVLPGGTRTLWDAGIREHAIHGAPERPVIDTIERYVARYADDDAATHPPWPRRLIHPSRVRPPVKLARAVLRLPPAWTRRQHAILHAARCLDHNWHSITFELASYATATGLRDRQQLATPDEATLRWIAGIHAPIRLDEHDARRLLAEAHRRARTLLPDLDATTLPRALGAHARRYGLPLKPTAYRLTLLAAQLLGSLLREGSDAERAFESAFPQTDGYPERLWRRLFSGATGIIHWREYLDGCESWVDGGGRLVAAAAHAAREQQAPGPTQSCTARWTSPSVPRSIDGTNVQAIETPTDLFEEGERMDHCVATFLRDCLAAKRPLHVYRLEGPGRSRSTLGLREQPQAAAIFQHTATGDSRPTPHHEHIARIVRGHVAGALADPRYDHAARRRERRSAAEILGIGDAPTEPEREAMRTAFHRLYPPLKRLLDHSPIPASPARPLLTYQPRHAA